MLKGNFIFIRVVIKPVIIHTTQWQFGDLKAEQENQYIDSH